MTAAPNEIVVKVDPEIADMVPRFLANRARDVAALRAALERSDPEAARKTGHALKGVGGGYGFPEVSILGERIEEAAAEGRPDAVRAAVDELDDYLARVRVEVGP